MKKLTFALVLILGVATSVRVHSQQQETASGAIASSFSRYDESKLSQPRYNVRVERNVRMPMRDGVELAADIYFPEATEKFPAILFRTIYNRGTLGFDQQARFFARRGYVVLVQDERGRYDADGSFYAFKNEANDGYDTDEWIGRQPWFNGNLGAMGGSYGGYVQWAQAVGGSKYLKEIFPEVTTGDIYNNWIYSDGVLHYGFALPWGGAELDGHTNQFDATTDWAQAFPHLPVSTSDEAAGHRTRHYRDWIQHPTRDSYWDGINWDDDYEKISTPAFSVDGWYDIFVRGALNDDMQIRKRGKTREAREYKHIMIGPWAHSEGGRVAITGRSSDPTPLDFGDNAVVDIDKLALRWHDYWLKGIDNGVVNEPPVKIFVMGENYWRYENEWPLARTKYVNYYIRSGGKANSSMGDGTISTQAPGSSRTDTFAYDPAHAVPSLGGNVCCSSVPSGPWDQRPIERRDDVLVYDGPILNQALEVTGPIKMVLYASTSAKDTDWTAKLVDVYPDGRAINIQSGIVRARYRNGAGRGKSAEPVQPGKIYTYGIDMWATSQVFLPGHRMRIEISSSDFPRFDRNLNTGEDSGTGTRMEIARQTIYHDAQHPSHIVLPVIPLGGQRPAAGTSCGSYLDACLGVVSAGANPQSAR